MLGARPTHPELLDYLASELPRSVWSLKRMHKLIMQSSVYRQSSQRNPTTTDDAENALYSRFPLRRLDAEVLRDRMLIASGTLNRTMFGPPVDVVDDFVGQVVVKDDLPRRSVYLQARRTKGVSFLTTFDAPVMTVNCERRILSTGAQQSLMLMNSDFVLKQAGLLAQRVRGQTPLAVTDNKDEAEHAVLSAWVRCAWQIAYQRSATENELELANQFLLAQLSELRSNGEKADHELAALTSLCQQLLSSNEFLYAD
jgi:hypothetical protein